MKQKGRKRLLESSDGTVGSPTEIHPEPFPRMRARKPTADMLQKMHPIRVDLYKGLNELIIREIRSDEELNLRTYGLVDGWDRSIWPLEIGPIQIFLSDRYNKEDLFGYFGRLIGILKRGFSDSISYSIEQNSYGNPEGMILLEIEREVDNKNCQFLIQIDVMIYVRSDVQRLDKTGNAIILWNSGQNDIRNVL
jgi:hypothetical protein